MKKSAIFLGFLSLITLPLTGCDTKDYTMTFDEAYNISKQSAFQDILLNTANFEQSVDISTNVNNESTNIALNLQANSKQDIENTKSESTTKFDAKINIEDNNISTNWILDLKLVDKTIYLNLKSLDITWSEDMSFISAMADWFKNQRYSISMEWLGDVPNSFSYLKEANDINEKANEIVINEWFTTYEWKFSKFHWYNAWKISLNNEKLQEFINEYFSHLYESLNEEYADEEIPQLNIQEFEWYLVITWKDKVATVVDTLVIDDTTMSLYSGEDIYFTVSQEADSLLEFSAIKKASKYDVSAKIQDIASLNWTISPKIGSSDINVNFDITLNITSTDNDNQDPIIIPLKGNRTYKSIPDFSISIPEESQDLSELLSSYLWGMMWWDEYDYDYEDYDYEDYEDYEDYDYENFDTFEDEAE